MPSGSMIAYGTYTIFCVSLAFLIVKGERWGVEAGRISEFFDQHPIGNKITWLLVAVFLAWSAWLAPS